MANPKEPYKLFFPNLDGLRFIAFFLVFLQHAFLAGVNTYLVNDNPILKYLTAQIFNGAKGVSIFFVLSGFLITYLILTEIKLNQKLDIKRFYLRRFLRIWPLYYAVIIFVFIVYPYSKTFLGIHSQLGSTPLYYFIFISNFDVIHVLSHGGASLAQSGSVTWSVAIEEQFYLVWPIFFLLLRPKYYIFIFYVIIAASLFFKIIHIHDSVELYFHSLSAMSDLALGGLTAYYALNSPKFIAFFLHLTTSHKSLIYLGSLLILIGGKFIMPSNGFATVFFPFMETVLYAFIIMEQNFSNTKGKLENLKHISSWGKYTYGLYLLHSIVLLQIENIFRISHIPIDSFFKIFIVGITGLVLSLALSYFSYRYFESYFLRMKRRFSYIQKE